MSKVLCTSPAGSKVSEQFDPISRSLVFSWTDTYSDFPGQTYAHQLLWSEGTSTLHYGTNVNGRGWVNVPVQNPDFYPSNKEEARAMAIKFIAAGEDES